jgi:hypothetical protein
VRKAILAASFAGRDVVEVNPSDPTSQVSQTVSYALTFGTPTLIVTPAEGLDPEAVVAHVARGETPISMVLVVDGDIDEKKVPAVSPVHGAYRISYPRPGTRRDRERAAAAFARKEASRLLGTKEALSGRLSDALVSAVGTDFGIISAEVSKVTAFARHGGATTVNAAALKGTLHRPGGVDLLPVSKALAASDAGAMFRALLRLRDRMSDPVMLLLRARGGPGYLAILWLRIAVLIEAGASEQEIVDRLGIPGWSLKREVPAAKRWGTPRLKGLVVGLARVEEGVLRGAPSPWVSCVSTLIGSCKR